MYNSDNNTYYLNLWTMFMAITMTELTRPANISQSTLSLVLNEREGCRINPAIEERIKRLAKRHDFRTNRVAVELRRCNTSLVGISVINAHPENRNKGAAEQFPLLRNLWKNEQ